MEVILSQLSDFFKSYSGPVLFVALSLILSAFAIHSKLLPRHVRPHNGGNVKQSTKSKFSIKDALPAVTIEPVDPNFDWEKEKPVPYRPFKNAPYRINMAIQKADPQNIIVIENTYLKSTKLRERIMNERAEISMACHPSAEAALKELYCTVTDFLMKKYPMYFYTKDNGTTFYNKIKNESFPLDPTMEDRLEVLKFLGRTIEEDFIILLKNGDEGELENEYVWRAGVSCYPSGFVPGEKFNKPLTAIHSPVPQYLERLKVSMNRFFERLRVHEFVVRYNWSIQAHTNIFAPSMNHGTRTVASVKPLSPEDLDFNKVFMRVEKQCFTRLPKTKADIMFIRTYTTPLTRIKAENRAEDFCGAIDGLSDDFAIYKNKILWGDAVKAFLKGESSGSTEKVYDFDIFEAQLNGELMKN
ncbi:hypothetical protein KL930_001323 [Ogataea haglerorum]|uniref:Uncharacterized protein n=1 Tax=Ogataea haglerorum TaxID=1937702 RepID=A0ABQ7RGA9_9ASCO|nr:uncharacterized protein KL911_003724 [Ogataea haglerorum]KAG7695000.1 hypothetical protein KL915_003233 [Ogataea haglerorum]KAG7698545.1 hypothetical protein KL951_001809 [Ogataea haglerorum]KAG7706325.1 hypothetical protein KL914_003220 [Ogataea haglerorum]KAG7707962.1 hypothetical protein KL950_002588 [Ogataea haglerorum]KAG7717240.1 hypothetical protein KL913_002991 [Ogataea haglerorum]